MNIKYLGLLVFAFITLASCTSNNNSAIVTEKNTVDTNTISDAPVTETIALQKDGKWNADAATNKNVSQLQTMAAQLNEKPRTTVNDYHAVSAALQTGLNQLVKECTMKGTDHDALHLWLEPVLSETKALKDVSDVVTGERLFHSIRTRLLDYNLYFN